VQGWMGEQKKLGLQDGCSHISAKIRMRQYKEKGRHSHERANPDFCFFTVISISNALDPGFRLGDENPNPAISKFNNLRAYLSVYRVQHPAVRDKTHPASGSHFIPSRAHPPRMIDRANSPGRPVNRLQARRL